MAKECRLTTFDNPYDPFTQFNQWYMFDVDMEYNSSSRVARIAKTSDQLSEEENEREIERAIDEIIKYDFLNVFKKVTRTT